MWEANMNLLGFKAIMVIFFLQFVRQHKMHNGAHSFPFLCFLKFLVIMSCNASMNGSTVVDNCISLHLVLRWHHRIYNVLWICLWFVNCHGYSIGTIHHHVSYNIRIINIRLCKLHKLKNRHKNTPFTQVTRDISRETQYERKPN